MLPGGQSTKRLMIGLASVLGLLLVAATSAIAAPGWLAATKLSASGAAAEKPQVATDASGDDLAVWERPDGETAEPVIEAAARSAGSGPWETAQVISDKTLTASLPQVGLDGAGDAVAVWLSYDGSDYTYLSATRLGATGAWGKPVVVQNVGETPSMEPRPDLSVDSGGGAVIVWERPSGSDGVVEAVSRPGASSPWSSPQKLSETAEAMHPPEVAIDAAGDATAVWEEKAAGVQIAAAEKPAGGQWRGAGLISQSGANEPRVAVDGQGAAVAIWERFNGELGEEIVEAASRPSAGVAWAAPVAITKPEPSKGEPAGQQVALAEQGRAVITWSRTDADRDIIEASVGDALNSTWGAPVALSAPAGAVEEAPQPGVDPNGDAIVVWEQWSGAMKIIEASSGSAVTGRWGPAIALSGAGEEADEAEVSLDPEGDAAAVWRRFDGSFYIAEGAGFDAAGPRLNGLSLPSAGTVGQPLAFAVSPFDTWSPLGATTWTLGDGSTLAGASVTHAYAAPGSYTVDVTSSDALGNTSTAGAVVQISAPNPLISGARLSHGRFRVASRPTAVSARVRLPLGTAFHFTLNESARVQILFTRRVSGRRAHGRCVAPTAKLRAHHARRCTRTLKPGTLTRAIEAPGARSISFSGRIGKRPLAPGNYHATITAGAFGRTSAPITLALSVVR